MPKKEPSWGRADAQVLVEQLELSPTVNDGLDSAVLKVGKPLSKRSAYYLLEREGLGSPGGHVGRKCRAAFPAPSEDEIPVEWEEGDSESALEQAPIEDDPAVLDRGELERTAYLPDTHWEYRSRPAWALAMKAIRAWRPHRIVWIGDFVDFFQVSSHDRDPRRGTQLKPEIDHANEGIEEVLSLGAQKHVFCAGNHEFRLTRYIWKNAPALADMVSIEQSFRFAERGILYVPYRRHVRIGRLRATHDVGFAGIHGNHQSGQAMGHSIIWGHSHRLGLNYFGNVAGERHVAMNVGWLGDVASADYESEAKRRFWQLGFGVSIANPTTGWFDADVVPIVGRRCELAGKVYEA